MGTKRVSSHCVVNHYYIPSTWQRDCYRIDPQYILKEEREREKKEKEGDGSLNEGGQIREV